jgi:hypothetical protein
MKKKNFKFAALAIIFIVGVVFGYAEKSIYDKAVKGKTVKNLDKKSVIVKKTGCYTSTLTHDNNATNHLTIFNHNLNAIPEDISIYFTPDGDNYYPVTWRWLGIPMNPVTIKVTKDNITLSITEGGHLFSAWSPSDGGKTGKRDIGW